MGRSREYVLKHGLHLDQRIISSVGCQDLGAKYVRPCLSPPTPKAPTCCPNLNWFSKCVIIDIYMQLNVLFWGRWWWWKHLKFHLSTERRIPIPCCWQVKACKHQWDQGVYIWISLSPISLEKEFDFPTSPTRHYTNWCFNILLVGWPRRPWNVGTDLPTQR